jgi:hypothetical protein
MVQYDKIYSELSIGTFAERLLSSSMRIDLLLSVTVLRTAPGGPGCLSVIPIAKA